MLKKKEEHLIVSKKRFECCNNLKPKVALGALRIVESLAELSQYFEVHATMTLAWKRELFKARQITGK